MKKYFVILAFLGATAASAQGYVTSHIGIFKPEAIDAGLGLGVEGGYFFKPTFSAGAYLEWALAESSKRNVSFVPFGGYAQYHFPDLVSGLYAGGALGLVRTQVGLSNASFDVAVGPRIGYLAEIKNGLSLGGRFQYQWVFANDSTYLMAFLGEARYEF
jgi:hypothetical protein